MLKNGQQAFTVVDEKVFSDGSRTTTSTPITASSKKPPQTARLIMRRICSKQIAGAL